MSENYSSRSPGVKRLMREAAELSTPTEEYCAYPLENNLFEWHFTIRGCAGTDFEGGFYHGRITLPSNYPMSPPVFIFTTPNGRFEIDKKICLSISEHHPETWQPSWSIRTALTALIAFMPTPGNGTIGSLDYTSDERKKLARKSQRWTCAVCGPIQDKFLHGNSIGHVLGRGITSPEELIPPVNTEEPRGTENREPEEIVNHCETPVTEIRNPIERPEAEIVIGVEARNKRPQWNIFMALIILLIAVLLYRRWKIDRLLFL